MQLSPLQSRLAASLVASCLLVLLYLTLFPPQFALAAELDYVSPIILDDVDFDFSPDAEERSPLDPDYEPAFGAFDRSIMGRAPAGVTALTNNAGYSMNVVSGTTQVFMFSIASVVSGNSSSSRSLELRAEGSQPQQRDVAENVVTEEKQLVKRQANTTLFISANTCLQPQMVDPSSTAAANAPQLTLYVSTSLKNQSPGPLADPSTQTPIPFTEGAAMYSMNTSSDLYLGIYAPNMSAFMSSTTYNFEVAVSVDSWYHSYNVEADADLIWVDSDFQSALLMTHNLTDSTDPQVDEQIMLTQPYVMFAQNANDPSTSGVMYSYCGLQNYAQIAATKNGKFTSMVTTSMTRRGQGSLPKQEFYFSGLNSSAQYMGILAASGSLPADVQRRGTPTIGGGGHVFRATNFSTESNAHENCALITNLTFCNQVMYTVPSNPNNTAFADPVALGKWYDDYAAAMFDTFANKALAQIACEAPSTQAYSLARNCSDCESAYKDWLCTVTIPKCQDFSTDAPYLQPRAINQTFPDGSTLDAATIASFPQTNAFLSSRNPLIDSVIAPGPYKEVLPCDDLCYALVQSCPAALGFACPLPGNLGFNTSYSMRTQLDAEGGLTCNYQGSAHVFSGANGGRHAHARRAVPWALLGASSAALGLMLL